MRLGKNYTNTYDHNMKYINREIILIVIAIIGGIVLAYMTYPKDRKVIDCAVAEISPDFSVEHREFCRRMRMKYNN